jgi:hypothetical protein
MGFLRFFIEKAIIFLNQPIFIMDNHVFLEEDTKLLNSI